MKRSKRKNLFAHIVSFVGTIGLVRIGAVLAIAVVGAYISFVLAVAGVTRSRNPSAALQFVPSEGVALARQAELLFRSSPEAPPPMVAQLARRSLRSQAVNPRALRLLGYAYSQNDRTEEALTFIDLAARQSRREPGAQLWLVQQAAAAGDLTMAIEHIDILLRTQPNSQTVLFPILVSGLPDPRFRALLRQYMDMSTPWLTSFLSFAITNANDLAPLVKLIEEKKGFPESDVAAGQARQLMGRLNDAGQFASLRKIYLLMPNADPSRLRETRLDDSDINEDFGIAGWQAFDVADAGAHVVVDGEGQQASLEMLVYVNPSLTRQVASKLLYIEPGRYTVATTVPEVDAGPNGSLNWQLRCPTRKAGGRPWIGRIASKNSRMTFTVPVDCPVQFLDLIASGGDGHNGLDATIGSVRLYPAESGRSRD